MGTINYGSNDYINLGVIPAIDDEDERDELDFIRKSLEKRLLDYSFEWFSFKVESGYYDGFYLEIEDKLPWYFNDYAEKQAAQKEITQIRKLLEMCVTEYGLIAYWAGWCTTYKNTQETLELLKDGIAKMRETVKKTCTYMQWERKYKGVPIATRYAMAAAMH